MNPFDNKLEPSIKQAAWLQNMPEVQALEQTRSGNILVVDTLNPYLPLYILTPEGGISEVTNYYGVKQTKRG